MLNQQSPQALDDFKKSLALLFHQNASEKDSQRPHIATQWEFLRRIAGIGGEFRKPGARLALTPQGDISHASF
jgi:hypothetical protein